MSVRRSILETSDCFTWRTLARFSCVSSRAARSLRKGISSSIRRNSRALSARAAGDIFSRNSLNFLAILGCLLLRCFSLQLLQVLIVQLVGFGYVDVVPPVFSRLVAADQQDRRALRVERIQHAKWLPVNLDAELAHMRVSRPVHAGILQAFGQRHPS